MKKIVFFDIDGTIIDTFHGKNDISPAVKQAIHKLQSLGHYVFIATGRPYAFISHELWDFGFDGFVLSNGAQVVLNGKTIYEDKMDKAFVKVLANELNAHDIQYVLEGSHHSYIRQGSQRLVNICESINVPLEMIKRDYDIDKVEVYKAEIFCDNEKIEKHCKEVVNQYPDYGYYYSINGCLLEVFAKRNHKAKGIEKTLEILNIPTQNSYAFGDGENDIEMLKTVGCGIAMGNASDHVKSFADIVTDTVGNDGVAMGINKFILNEECNESVG